MSRPWERHYPEGVRPHLEYPEMLLQEMVDRAAVRWPGRVATIFMNHKLTFAELLDRANRLAAALAAQGLSPGDRVAIMLPNCPQAVIAYFAVLKAGGVVVQCNPLYVEREIEFQLKDSGAAAMIVLDLLYPRVERIRDNVPSLQTVIATSLTEYMAFPLHLLFPVKIRLQKAAVKLPPASRVLRLDRLLRNHPPVPPPVKSRPDDLAVLQYTGGTTGASKGAMLSHRHLIANILQTREWLGPSGREGAETVVCALPFFHVYGMTTCMNLGVYMGATMVLLPRFIVKDLVKAIVKHRPTLFPGAPTMYVSVVNHPGVEKLDLSSITACISGSAPLPVEVQKRFEELTGGRLVEGYGLTEASPVTHANPILGPGKIGTIGLPFPDTEARIVDLETGEVELPAGEAGELVVRGPQVMQGYWRRPEEDAITLRDGWLFTGDVARMDEEGYFTIVDRKKDMIIAGGYNIYPRDIEEVLYQHPMVQEAAVVGVPDEYRGETVKAFIVPRTGEPVTAADIIEYCRANMARFKVPREVEFRESLPKNMVGKVLRRQLLEEELRLRGG